MRSFLEESLDSLFNFSFYLHLNLVSLGFDKLSKIILRPFFTSLSTASSSGDFFGVIFCSWDIDEHLIALLSIIHYKVAISLHFLKLILVSGLVLLKKSLILLLVFVAEKLPSVTKLNSRLSNTFILDTVRPRFSELCLVINREQEEGRDRSLGNRVHLTSRNFTDLLILRARE